MRPTTTATVGAAVAVAAAAGTAVARVAVRRRQESADLEGLADTATVVSGLRRLAISLEAGDPISRGLAIYGAPMLGVPPGLWQAAAGFADPEDPDGEKAAARLAALPAAEPQSIQDVRDSGRIEGEVTICGTVTGVHERINRAQNSWATVTVDDGSGTIDVLLFPKHWQHVGEMRAGKRLTVAGRLNESPQGLLEVFGHGPDSPAWLLES
jgi:DNA/RNA endonuclease YhcR with UshA esterase domain